MPFKYLDINSFRARDGELFIFDANVWLFWFNRERYKPQQRAPYERFMNRLQNLLFEPQVLLPACVLSEVVNKLLNKGSYYERFMKSSAAAVGVSQFPEEKDWFKKVYRAHPQYLEDRNMIYDSIFSFSQNLEFIDDGFSHYNFQDLKTSSAGLDFTDWQICEAAAYFKAIIVTDDSDFILEDQTILTARPSLLNRNTSGEEHKI